MRFFGRGEEPDRQPGDPDKHPDTASSATERRRDRRQRIPWLLILGAALLIVLLAGAAILLWRSFSDSLSGTSVARDSIDSGPKPGIRLTNGAGQIRIEGVEDLGAVEYEVTRHALASDPAAAKERASEIAVDISRDGGDFTIETNGGRNTGADYALRVPTGSSVEVESEAGDVEVSGLSGDVSVDAGAGDISVREAKGSVQVEAQGGDVEILEMRTDTGGAEIEVSSGDVTLRDLVVGTLETSVDAGDVTLSGRFSGGGRVSVKTGDIIAQLPTEDTRDLTLEAEVGEVVREDAAGTPSEDPGEN